MNHCATCKYMTGPGYGWDGADLYKCARVHLPYDCHEWTDEGQRVRKPEYANDLAFVQDASDYSAMLLMTPEFGCVMHEEKQP